MNYRYVIGLMLALNFGSGSAIDVAEPADISKTAVVKRNPVLAADVQPDFNGLS